jgi:hypothetical protein
MQAFLLQVAGVLVQSPDGGAVLAEGEAAEYQQPGYNNHMVGEGWLLTEGEAGIPEMV